MLPQILSQSSTLRGHISQQTGFSPEHHQLKSAFKGRGYVISLAGRFHKKIDQNTNPTKRRPLQPPSQHSFTLPGKNTGSLLHKTIISILLNGRNS